MAFVHTEKTALAFARPGRATGLIVLSLLLTTCGCCPCKHSGAARPAGVYQASLTPSPLNPHFIFDRPAQLSPPSLGWPSSESFGRKDWPVSPEASTYEPSRGVIAYQEHVYSNEYISGDSRPRLYYHRQINGYRSSEQYR